MADDKQAPKGVYVLRNTTMFIDGVEYGEGTAGGDEVELDRKRGDALAEQGLVIAKGDVAKVDGDADKAAEADAKAQQEAADAAAAAERVKLRSAERAREDQIHAAPIRRSPGRPRNDDK